MTSKELTQEGITAIKDGDTTRAHDLLQQAVELDPKNAKAWYFLSRTQTSNADKRFSLEQVLALMPNNKPAREALEQLPPDDVEDLSEFEDETPASSGYKPPISMGFGTGTKPKIGNVQFPVAIPDAPEQIEPKTIFDNFVTIFKNGIEILRQTPDVYAAEIYQATWWRFWQFVIVGLVIGSVISTITDIIFQFQLVSYQNSSPFVTEAVSSPNVFTSLLSLIVFIPMSVFILYVGVYASYRFVTSNYNGQGTFAAHAYAIGLPVVTASLIGDFASILLILMPLFGVLFLVLTVVLWVYSMYIASKGLVLVHRIDTRSSYWTIAVLVGIQFVASLALSPFILSSGLGFI